MKPSPARCSLAVTQAPQRWGKPEPDQMLKHRPGTTLAALENRCTRERTEGSNPDLSATT